MLVSVIVPVRNEAANLRETLLDLAAQDFPVSEFEILVVDGASEDATVEIVIDLQRTIPNLHLFSNPKRLSSAGRNIGVREAAGEFIVIVDGHCRIDEADYLNHLVNAFRATDADSLGRPQPLRAPSPTPFQTAVGAARASWLGHNPDSSIYSERAQFVPADNVAVAYRREVFERIGLFDEAFDACEDVEFNTRLRQAGMTCYFTPAIRANYQPRSSLRGLVHQMMRYGRGRAKLAWKHPTTVTPPSLVPPMGLLWLIAGTILAAFVPMFAWVWLAIVLIYAFVLVAESWRVGRVTPGLSWRRLPLVFAAIHAGFAWGYLAESPRTAVRGLSTRWRRHAEAIREPH